MATDQGAAGHIYSATYSNVPVYEFKIGTESIMRRRVDDWVNATHILKTAGLDKPSRTRILEREVQRGVHEKIQGGYGKYQGTWIPLPQARALAEKNGVLGKLSGLLDFAPGDQSPPPVPKGSSASSKPRVQRSMASNRRLNAVSNMSNNNHTTLSPVNRRISAAPPAPATGSIIAENSFTHDNIHQSFNESMTTMNSGNPGASSMMSDERMDQITPESSLPRKRKHGTDDDVALSILEQNHILYGDQLLDYFMTVGDVSYASSVHPPTPPANFQVDRAIDDQGNTALHWACAMGDLGIVKDLIDHGADVRVRSHHDETPLVRAVLFTNNYEKRTMLELADLLQSTITFRDWFGATVFNHLAATTRSKGKWKSSRYYCQVLMDKLVQIFPRHEISLLLSSQDANGDTAALTAAKHGCYRLATMLLAQCPEAGELRNRHNETANEVLMSLYRRRKDAPPAPSSVTQDDDFAVNVTSTKNPEGHEETIALLNRIGSIMSEANRRLSRAYGEAKTPSQGPGAITNPKGFYEQLEIDRVNVRNQISLLREKEEQSESHETLVARYNAVKTKYMARMEREQKAQLEQLFRETGCLDLTPAAPDSIDLSNAHDVMQKLTQAQTERRTLVHQLVEQRANAGVSAKLDVHRKLVSLATGLPEDELDPMSSELADALEFDRANEKGAAAKQVPPPSSLAGLPFAGGRTTASLAALSASGTKVTPGLTSSEGQPQRTTVS